MITRGANNNLSIYAGMLIALVTTNVLVGQPLPLHGDGGNTREWIEVEDNCRALGWPVQVPLEDHMAAIVMAAHHRASHGYRRPIR